MSGDESALRGGVLHFDCAAGIAGDMTVGALVDLGVPESVVREALAALPLSGYRVGFERVRRGALVGTQFRVVIDGAHDDHPHHDEHHHDEHHHPAPHQHAHVHEEQPRHAHQHEQPHAALHHEHPPAQHAHAHHGDHAHRHYAEIRRMLLDAPLAEGVRRRALTIFDRIAQVEARLHGTTVGEVAFHEVGAIDSIVDIVGAAAAIEWLAPVRITSRPVALGHGSVRTAHGLLPLPAPATLELLAGAAVEDGDIDFELTTPTGAAILAASVSSYGALPAMMVAGVGWGAGERELPDRPNLLRVVVGRPLDEDRADDAGERCVVVEANVDDMTPELVAPLIGELLAAGARDAWVQPVLMKKGRPGYVVSALATHAVLSLVERALFRGSTTIGARRYVVSRTVLPRRMVVVETPFGAVSVKVAGTGEDENAAPELEDCARLACDRGVPLRRVHAEALAAYYRR